MDQMTADRMLLIQTEAEGRAMSDTRIMQKLADILISHMLKIFREKPQAELTEVGFDWALGMELRRHWPDVPTSTASRWLREYIGVKFGSPGYAWTAASAKEVAAQYVEEFGEAL